MKILAFYIVLFAVSCQNLVHENAIVPKKKKDNAIQNNFANRTTINNVNAHLKSAPAPIYKITHCSAASGISFQCNTSQILNAPSGNYKFLVELDSSLRSKFLQKLECTAIDDSAIGKFVQNTIDLFLQLSTVKTVGKIQYPQKVIVAFCID